MNTKHTPGNWRFAWHNNHDAQITFACVVLDDEVVVIGHGEEKVAKAHLIAAAPELLAALEWLVDEYESVISSEFGTTAHPNPSASAPEVIAARAAIAKATGASHVHDQ